MSISSASASGTIWAKRMRKHNNSSNTSDLEIRPAKGSKVLRTCRIGSDNEATDIDPIVVSDSPEDTRPRIQKLTWQT